MLYQNLADGGGFAVVDPSTLKVLRYTPEGGGPARHRHSGIHTVGIDENTGTVWIVWSDERGDWVQQLRWRAYVIEPRGLPAAKLNVTRP